MSAQPAKSKVVAITLAMAWLAIVVTGTLAMVQYAGSPGEAGSPPLQWPSSSSVHRAGDHPTLVMFVHPHCPCSRASIGELALLMANCHGLLSAHAVFIQPTEKDSDWVFTDTWRDAARIPGVSVYRDEGGREASLFNAQTSGDTVLYDAKGILQFHGGITVARGHSGDNLGRDTVQNLVLGLSAQQRTTPAFGCSLISCQTKRQR